MHHEKRPVEAFDLVMVTKGKLPPLGGWGWGDVGVGGGASLAWIETGTGHGTPGSIW